MVPSVCTMCIYTMYVYNYVTKKTAVLYLDSHKPSQKLILLARKIYMVPKILSIASELSIECRSRIFLLRVLALTTISLCRNEQQGGATSEEAGHVCNVIRCPVFFSIVSV